MENEEVKQPAATNAGQEKPKEEAIGAMVKKYTDEIAKLKENTVPKEAYEKSQEENRQLLKSLVKGQEVSKSSEDKEEAVDIAKLRKELYTEDCELSNLDYAKKTLELRKAIISKGGHDPFLAYGQMITPTDDDAVAANNVAETLQACIDYADGDSELFTQELQRVMIDTAPVRVKKNKKR